MQTTYIFLNGAIVPSDQAAISPFDIGLLRGYAVFDLLRTVGGVPFLLAEHLTRLRASADQLGLIVPFSDEEIGVAVRELLALNGHAEATVRLVLTGGLSPDGMHHDPATPTFYILTHELHEPPSSLYEVGGALLTHEHIREIPTAKTTNYLTMIQNRPRTVEAGALDLLYHSDGYVLEAASASVYFVRDSIIHAPAENVLWGTVGTLALGFAEEKYRTVFGPVSMADALSSDEVFLTSTTRGVVPIVRIDDAIIGGGTPGPITRHLSETYRDLLSSTSER
jgi:branched-subunit amino acid aminotransferase/4-amino-4-deoxychorismate lyase